MKHDIDQVLEFIVRYKKDNDGNSPSHREICEGTGMTSTSVVAYVLKKMEKMGMIELVSRREGQSRAISVKGGKWVYEYEKEI